MVGKTTRTTTRDDFYRRNTFASRKGNPSRPVYGRAIVASAICRTTRARAAATTTCFIRPNTHGRCTIDGGGRNVACPRAAELFGAVFRLPSPGVRCPVIPVIGLGRLSAGPLNATAANARTFFRRTSLVSSRPSSLANRYANTLTRASTKPERPIVSPA